MRVPGLGPAGHPRGSHQAGPAIHLRPHQPDPPHQDRAAARRDPLHRTAPAPRRGALQGPPESEPGRGKQTCLHDIQVGNCRADKQRD